MQLHHSAIFLFLLDIPQTVTVYMLYTRVPQRFRRGERGWLTQAAGKRVLMHNSFCMSGMHTLTQMEHVHMHLSAAHASEDVHACMHACQPPPWPSCKPLMAHQCVTAHRSGTPALHRRYFATNFQIPPRRLQNVHQCLWITEIVRCFWYC